MFDVGIIVPVLNEAGTIATVLSRLADVPLRKEIIVVDDGSTDETPQIVKRWFDERQCHVIKNGDHFTSIRHETNWGKGLAIRTGLEYVTALVIMIQDADLEYDPSEIPKLLLPIREGIADVVYGSRYLNDTASLSRPPRLYRYGVSLLNFAVRVLYGVKLTDEATCYKVFRTAFLRSLALECERFEFCPEVTAKACRLGARIVEMPITYSPRSVQEGKKIRLRDGIEALCTLWKFRNWSMPSCTADYLRKDETENVVRKPTVLPRNSNNAASVIWRSAK